MTIKIGRNDPCWCGSGKKYKSCHAAFDDRIKHYANLGHEVPEHSMLKKAEDAEASGAKDNESDKKKFEDEFAESNSVPYKLELTFHIADPEGRSYRSNTAPVIRIAAQRIPLETASWKFRMGSP